MAETHRYLIALGSNMRHHRIGGPRAVLAEAIDILQEMGLTIGSVSPIFDNPPIGPSQRRFANAAAVVEGPIDPPAMLALLKATEAALGRSQRGQRWRARVLDLDIILWSGGAWASRGLTIPHPAFRERGFVLGPAGVFAGSWRDPITGVTIHQLGARLRKKKGCATRHTPF